MTAVALQVRRRLPQPLDGRDAGGGADAALALGHDIDRFVEALQQLRRHDAHDARVPARVLHHQRRRLRVHLLQGLRQHLVLDAAAVLVAGVEVGGELQRPPRAGGGEQLQAQPGLAQAPGGVEPRRQHEGDLARADLAAQVRLADGGPDARPARVGQPREPLLDERPVLAQQGGHVGDGPDRGEVGVIQRRVHPQAPAQGPQQVEGHARAGELRQPAARQRRGGGVHHQPGGHGLAGGVVVGDDGVDPGSLQPRDLLEVGDAAVHGDEQLAARGVLRHPLGVDAVAVLQPVGDEGLDVPAQLAQPQQQHGRAGDAVGVVVAVDEDALARADGALEALGGGGHGGDAARHERRVEVVGSVVAQAARPQHGRQQRRHVQATAQRPHRAGRRRRAYLPDGGGGPMVLGRAHEVSASSSGAGAGRSGMTGKRSGITGARS